jgi:hypothetical protein
MLAKDMVFQKPRYVKTSHRKRVRQVARSLHTTSRSRSDVESPSLDELANAFYASCSTSAALQYAMPDKEPSYPPEADCNVVMEVEVESTAALPQSLVQCLKQYNSIEEVCQSPPTYSLDEAAVLEESTRNQADSDLWHTQRTGRITASTVHSIKTKVEKNKLQDVESTLKKLFGQQDISNLPAVKYGCHNEPIAADWYYQEHSKKHQNMKISKCGLFVMPASIYVAASPDRLVSCDCCGEGLLEMKCPYSIAGQNFKDGVTLDYLSKIDGTYQLKQTHPYYSQVQQQMGVTGRKWCDFMVFTKEDYFLQRIPFNLE